MNILKKYLNNKLMFSFVCILLFGYSHCSFAGVILLLSDYPNSTVPLAARIFKIYTCEVKPELASDIAQRLQSSTTLSIEDVIFEPEALQIITHALAKNTTVEQVRIANCVLLDDEAIHSIAKVLAVNHTILHFIFRGDISFIGTKYFADALKMNRSLTSFELKLTSSNSETDRDNMSYVLGEALLDNMSLQYFTFNVPIGQLIEKRNTLINGLGKKLLKSVFRRGVFVTQIKTPEQQSPMSVISTNRFLLRDIFTYARNSTGYDQDFYDRIQKMLKLTTPPSSEQIVMLGFPIDQETIGLIHDIWVSHHNMVDYLHYLREQYSPNLAQGVKK